MTAVLANDTSEVLRAVGVLVGTVALLALAIGLVIALVRGRKVTTHITTKLGAIDLAVNNVGPGEPPLIERVRRIEAAVARICTHLEIVHTPTEETP